MTDRALGAFDWGTLRETDRRRSALPAALAVGILAAGLGSVVGPIGLVIAAGTAIAWALVPVPYAIAVGHVALATLVPAGLDPLAVGIVEAGFVAVLAAALLRDPAAREALSVAALTLATTATAAWLALGALPLWGVAAVVLLIPAVVGYAIYRYGLAAFGFVAAETAIDDADGTPESTDDRGRVDATTASTATGES